MSIPILFLIASLGVFNGILVSVYLLFRKHSLPSDRYFGALLLSLCIRIGKSIFFYFNRETDLLILQIGLSACVFIGPFFYLYLKSLRQRQQHFFKKDLVLLALIATIIIAIGGIYPYRSYPEVWNGYIVYGIYIVWLLFLALGLMQYRKLLKEPSSIKNGRQSYLQAVVLAMCFITLTYQTALYIGITYIWGAITFTITFYYLAARMLLTSKPLTPKPVPQPLPDSLALLQKLDTLMTEEKPFKNKGLKLDELATKTGMNKHSLSKLLNETYQHGFAHYIKTYRVNETKVLIHSRPELSLEGIGYEAGFNSKSAFFEAFKKLENCTPLEYKKRKKGTQKLQSTPE